MQVLAAVFLYLSLEVSLVRASCAEGQAISWSNITQNLHPPSWPWECDKIYAPQDSVTYAEVRKAFEITGYEFLIWNCFLECQDGLFKKGDLVCVDATLDNPVTRSPITVPTFSVPSRTLSLGTPSSSPTPLRSDREKSPGLNDSSPEAHKAPRAWTFSAHSDNNSHWPKTSQEPTPTTSVPAWDYSTSAASKRTTLSEHHTGFPSSTSGSSYNPFTESCDSPSDAAEDCRVTTKCDASKSEYPTCVGSKCRCRAIPCSRSSECEAHNQCRWDDQEAVCKPEPGLNSEVDGICQCRTKVTNCAASKHDKHSFCSQYVTCTERRFSLYPEFAQCVVSSSDADEDDQNDEYYGGGRSRGECRCQHVDCDYEDGVGFHEMCRMNVKCPQGEDAVCSIKYLNKDEDGKKGYCTCPKGF